ncbi:MAG: hypothetical protein AAF483_07090 [Planctomycetota bacterium]
MNTDSNRSADEQPSIEQYLRAFAEYGNLQDRIRRVLDSLPQEVLQDFFEDSTFDVRLEDFEPGQGSRMFMPLPTTGTHVSRCVVLRKKLDRAPEDFALYIIAHEFAHAFLRNGGWGEISDKEEAADALALSWGYKKPLLRWF